MYVGSQGVSNWVEREVPLDLSRATGAKADPSSQVARANRPYNTRRIAAIEFAIGPPGAHVRAQGHDRQRHGRGDPQGDRP